jgi:hypothetical protein
VEVLSLPPRRSPMRAHARDLHPTHHITREEDRPCTSHNAARRRPARSRGLVYRDGAYRSVVQPARSRPRRRRQRHVRSLTARTAWHTDPLGSIGAGCAGAFASSAIAQQQLLGLRAEAHKVFCATRAILVRPVQLALTCDVENATRVLRTDRQRQRNRASFQRAKSASLRARQAGSDNHL